MEANIIRLVLIITACSLAEKHVYIDVSKPWETAVQVCRENYTELSAITNDEEEQVFRRLMTWKYGQIGLYRDRSDMTWKWSGGGIAPDPVSYRNYEKSLDSDLDYDYGYWAGSYFYLVTGFGWRNFFCLNLIVVEVQRSWDEAVDYCRETHTDLTSLISDNEMLMAQREVQERNIDDSVWIGLRYLHGGWFWVNRDPLVYQAWATGGEQGQQCSTLNNCVALSKDGQWEILDCAERLNFICN